MTRPPFAPTLALASMLLVTACASSRIKRENAMALAAADALVLQGCYECLLGARTTYERLTTSQYANRDTLALRSFETNLLLALRQKELVLDWRPTLERAKTMTPRVPSAVDAQRLVNIVDAVLPDANGRMNDWLAEMRRERAAFVPKIPGEISWLSTAPLRSEVREYISLALDCSYDARVLAPIRQQGTSQRRPVLAPEAPPIVIYRTGICLTADANMLAAVLAVVPDFHEAAYFAGTAAAFGAEEDGGEGAGKLLGQAYRHLPNVPGVPFMSGWLAMTLGDCTTAVRYFDETVAIDSAHEVALLQATICLSRLRDDSAAIAHATRLLALRTASAPQAYYWRAVSRLRLKELALARSDIEAAKALDRDANALTMAGIIENEQNDLAIAERDLRDARSRPQGDQNCTAAWTLGLVLGKANRPGVTADTFEAAMDCYDFKVAVIRRRIEKLENRPSPNPVHTLRRIAALAADSVDQRKRYHASAFNAAGYRANAGRRVRAIELLDVAARDTSLTDRVAKLRDALRPMREQ
jgi:tetratricopeptide (TPR) repeat protein